jgi:glycosyltransferase involved in cell wall biosynthesis
MQISLLTDGIFPYTMGGMQKHSYYLTKYLARAGIMVDVYYGLTEGKSVPEKYDEYSEEELNNIRFFPLNFPKSGRYPGHYIIENYYFSKRVNKELIRHSTPDFIYIQGFAGWYFLQNRRKQRAWNKIKTGINFHGVEMFQKAANLNIKFQHFLLRPPTACNLKNADVLFSLGGKLTAIHKKVVPSSTIFEIPIGIACDWLVDPNKLKVSDKRRFTFIGRYERRKGIEEISSVLSGECRIIFSSTEFHLIGPIPADKQLKDFANIKYHGAIHDEGKIKELLQASDVLLCPSWSEGMPTVILEAMASGCAIITSDVGAVCEQVDSKNGILIRPGDKKQLKVAIEKMITMPCEQLLAMKKASINRIKEKFLWEKVTEQTITEIKKIIEER